MLGFGFHATSDNSPNFITEPNTFSDPVPTYLVNSSFSPLLPSLCSSFMPFSLDTMPFSSHTFFPPNNLPSLSSLVSYLFLLQESVLTSASLILPSQFGSNVPHKCTHSQSCLPVGEIICWHGLPLDSKILEIMDYIFFWVSAPNMKHGYWHSSAFTNACKRSTGMTWARASSTDAFLGDSTLLDKNDWTLLNQRSMSIWSDFLNLKSTTFKSFSQTLNRIILFFYYNWQKSGYLNGKHTLSFSFFPSLPVTTVISDLWGKCSEYPKQFTVLFLNILKSFGWHVYKDNYLCVIFVSFLISTHLLFLIPMLIQNRGCQQLMWFSCGKKILKIQIIFFKWMKTSNISQKKPFISFHLLKTVWENTIPVFNKITATVLLWPISTNFSLFW